VYGLAAGGPRKEEDPVNPLTAYARSKIGTEQGLRRMRRGEMAAICLRFATACGMSPRLRLDLVLNDFVACALAAGEITVLSDGSPWRPLIDVRDMARAVDWAVTTPEVEPGGFLAMNAGSDAWNVQVRDLAAAVAEAIPGTRVSINTAAPPDQRSYRVDFGLFRRLAPDHQPKVTLADSVQALRDGLAAIGFADREFRASQYMRLKVLDRLMAEGRLDPELRWVAPLSSAA
jgi:nucleoside-diphosphate-sugar epimerase